MSAQNAESWLTAHRQPLPALEIYARRALDSLQTQGVASQDFSEAFSRDPGLCVMLFQLVNASSQQPGDEGVDSVRAALNHADARALGELLAQHPVAEDMLTEDAQRRSYYQLMVRTYHMLAQLEGFTWFRKIGTMREMLCAGLLHNVGEYLACLFDYREYQKYEVQLRILGADSGCDQTVFGFSFRELGRIFAEQAHLPHLVMESLQDDEPAGSVPRWIRLADAFTRQAEDGWYHPQMRLVRDACASCFEQNPAEMERHLQQIALSAAQICPLADTMPAAARLIMLPERAPPVLTSDKKPELKQRLNRLLNLPGTSDVDFIDLLLTYLDEDLGMSRTALLLLSADKRELNVRATRGIDEMSPINTLLIETSQAGLLKQLLIKPQGLWMQTQNYARFKSGLPQAFNSSFDQQNFFLMSFFINGNPTGIIYCDRAQGDAPLSLDSYRKFKSAVLSVGVAMTQLSERRRRQTV